MASKSKKTDEPVLKNQADEVIDGQTALATVPAAPLARSHDYGDDAGMGFEETGKGLIPWLTLFQANSPQVEEKLVPGSEAGQFYNSSTGELVNAEVAPGESMDGKGLIIQPVYIQRFWVEWVPREKGGGIVGRYTTSDPHVQSEIKRNGGSEIFGKLNPAHGKLDPSNNLADTRYVYFNILTPDGLDTDGIGVLACTSSKIKKLEQLIQSVKHAKGQPTLFAAIVRLTSFQDKQKKPPNKVFKNIQFTVFDRRLDLPVKERSQRFDLNTLLDPSDALYQAGRNLYMEVKGGEKAADFESESKLNPTGESEDAKEDRDF